MDELSASSRPPGEISAVIAASALLYCEGIALGLQRRGGIRVCEATSSASEAFHALGRHGADVLLLDLGVTGAHTLARRLAGEHPLVRVVAFAVDDSCDDVVLRSVEAGIAGWVPRGGSLDDLVRAVQSAARGELECSARIAALLSRRLADVARRTVPPEPPAAFAHLTAREREILELIPSGMTNKQIARTLGLRLPTVKNHVHHVLDKLGVRTRGEAGALVRAAAQAETTPS